MRIKISINPNYITAFGLFLHLPVFYFLAIGKIQLAGFFLIFAAGADFLDGKVARRTGKSSKFGAFLDSTFDRIGESFIFLGLAVNSFINENFSIFIISVLCLIGSFLISYTRARIEGLGGKCKVGVAQRGIRMLFLIAGFLLNLLFETLMILSIFVWITVLQRVIHSYRELSR